MAIKRSSRGSPFRAPRSARQPVARGAADNLRIFESLRVNHRDGDLLGQALHQMQVGV